jgi:hypothetical protein
LFGSFLVGEKFTRVFSFFIFTAYLVSAFLQNISISDQYGYAVSTSTFLLTLLVSFTWLKEFLNPANDFSERSHPQLAYFLIPFALLALWQPVDPSSMLPDFQLSNFITSGSSLTFCMMTIVSLAVLLSFIPKVNIVTLRITSAAGFLIGIGNLWLEFIYMPELFWVGVLHIPLVLLSAVVIYSSYRIMHNAAS